MNWGICFSGGGIKGVAHIGALKAFEEEKRNVFEQEKKFVGILCTIFKRMERRTSSSCKRNEIWRK